MLATNVVNDANADATNADTISVDDAMEVTAAATAVAFLVAEYYFHDSFRKMENLTQQRKRTIRPSCHVHTGNS